MPAFAFAVEIPAVDDETDRVTRVFALLREKLDAEMKCILDDKPELMGEKKDWNDRWDVLSVRRFFFLFLVRVSNTDQVAFDACFATAQAKGLQLDLPVADTTLIKSGNLAHARHKVHFA